MTFGAKISRISFAISDSKEFVVLSATLTFPLLSHHSTSRKRSRTELVASNRGDGERNRAPCVLVVIHSLPSSSSHLQPSEQYQSVSGTGPDFVLGLWGASILKTRLPHLGLAQILTIHSLPTQFQRGFSNLQLSQTPHEGK